MTFISFYFIGLGTQNKFKQELGAIEATRQDLSSAEKLFDLPPSSYSVLIAVQKEMRGLDESFAIYIEQKAAREQWSETLWANLNVQVLTDGIEGYHPFIESILYFIIDIIINSHLIRSLIEIAECCIS